ncbi:hypothetical protein GF345_03755, partial [Candidatus Woesearchaeota archaeon]|nr:hypothetical protein [Candidatus Woesearchaeota archaeon]
MEFLLTYGWAIIVVLVVIGALSYFGVLDPTSLLPEKCTLQTGPLVCQDQVIYAVQENNAGYVNIHFKNIFEDAIQIKSLNVTGSNFECASDFFQPRTVSPGRDACIGLSCDYPGDSAKKSMSLKLTYSKVDGLDKTLDGEIVSSIIDVEQRRDVTICNFGDGNADGKIDDNDMDFLIRLITGEITDPVMSAAYDLDQDGVVSSGDLSLMSTLIVSCTCCSDQEMIELVQEEKKDDNPSYQSACWSACGLPYDDCQLPVSSDVDDGMIQITDAQGFVFDDYSQVHLTLQNTQPDDINIWRAGAAISGGDSCYQSFDYDWVVPASDSACIIATCNNEVESGQNTYRAFLEHDLPGRTSRGYAAGNMTIEFQEASSFPSGACSQAAGDGNGDRSIDSGDTDMLQLLIEGQPIPSYLDTDAYSIGADYSESQTILQDIIDLCPSDEAKFSAADIGTSAACGVAGEEAAAELELTSSSGYTFAQTIGEDENIWSQLHAQFN